MRYQGVQNARHVPGCEACCHLDVLAGVGRVMNVTISKEGSEVWQRAG